MENNITTFEEYKKEYAKSINNPEAFWDDKAKNFTWHKKWDTVLQWDFTKPTIKWFEGYPLSNRPLLLLAVLLIVLGIQILSLGLIAEMINYNKYYKENGSKIKN
mgnify:CR=1 FL=1